MRQQKHKPEEDRVVYDIYRVKSLVEKYGNSEKGHSSEVVKGELYRHLGAKLVLLDPASLGFSSVRWIR